jgi:hypothetical protein
MISVLAATINAINIILCAGLVFYTTKALQIFRGGMMQRALEILVASVVLFLLAALARGALIWGILPPELDFVGAGIQTIAFVCLFVSFAMVVRVWTKFGTISTPIKL